MTSITQIVNGSITALSELTHDMFKNKKLDFIYLSIGSKQNSQYVLFNRPESIKNQQFFTNSHFQILPRFIEYKSDHQNTLIISVDDFSSNESRVSNHKLLEQKIRIQNMNIILFDKIVDKLFLETLLLFFVNLCDDHQISCENAMICNYVLHLNEPNSTELKSEELIPRTIQSQLDSTNYSTCFYQWFGYNYHCYNFIYRYKYNSMYHIQGFPTLLEKYIENNTFSPNGKTKQFFEFLSNIYDISSIDGELELR